MRTTSGLQFDNLFKVSRHGLTLDKNYYQAFYKTRVLKYKGRPLEEINWGNIISVTPIFDAANNEEALAKCGRYFNLMNPSFDPLDRKFVEAEHELLKVEAIKAPTFADADYSRFNTLNDASAGYLRKESNVKENCDGALPESFLGLANCSIRQRKPHFRSSDRQTVFLYHPWHGAGDTYTDWYAYPYGREAWHTLKGIFEERCQKEKERWEFEHTEYTHLGKREQECIRKYKQLNWLDKRYECYWDSCSLMGQAVDRQGYYKIQKDSNGSEKTPIFVETNAYNILRMTFRTKRERYLNLKRRLEKVEREAKYLQDEIRLLKHI